MITRRILLAASALLLATATVSAQTKIRFATPLPANSFFGTFVETFASEVGTLSGGEIEVEYLPSYSGGDERAAVEAVQLGTLDATLNSIAVSTNFVPNVGVLDLPYLFENLEHARAVQDGEIGDQIRAAFAERGLIAIGFADGGLRGVSTRATPVSKPEDLEGLKLRTMQSNDHLLAFRELGALPTPISNAELFTALQTGTVDGQENSIATVVGLRLFEAQKYFSPTNHVVTNLVAMFSQPAWEGFSDDEKTWVEQSIKKATAATRARIDKSAAEGLKAVKEAGMTVVENVDLDAFRAKLASAQVEYEKIYGKELLDSIKAFKY